MWKSPVVSSLRPGVSRRLITTRIRPFTSILKTQKHSFTGFARPTETILGNLPRHLSTAVESSSETLQESITRLAAVAIAQSKKHEDGVPEEYLPILNSISSTLHQLSMDPVAASPPLRTPQDILSDRRPYYITTPIYYVNAAPHIGHAYTSVVADTLARYSRSIGRPVYFLTGTDEHGQKVEQSAKKTGKTPLQFAAMNSEKFRDMLESLDCTHNTFIRTTDARHKEAVIAMWKVLEEKNMIYLGTYDGWYSVRDECFFDESEIIDGKAPTGAPVEWVCEPSYFFRMSAMYEPLLKFYESNPDFIRPVGRYQEMVNFIRQHGLRDLSISRTTFEWGIQVPDAEKHVVYVWLDALMNYLTAVGYPYHEDHSDVSVGSAVPGSTVADALYKDKSDDHTLTQTHYEKFWPVSSHIVGKDILRFHAIYWPAFLLAAGLTPPRHIFAHGWWTTDGEKMSKSAGNVVNPSELIDTYGAEHIRYYLATELSCGRDGDFTHVSLCHRLNAELANSIGNLLQRIMVPMHKYCNGRLPAPDGGLTSEEMELLQAGRDLLVEVDAMMARHDLKGVADAIHHLMIRANQLITESEPWKLCKSEETLPRFRSVMYVNAELLRLVAIYLESLMPETSIRILDQLGATGEFRTMLSTQMTIRAGGLLGEPRAVFPRLEVPSETKSQDSSLSAEELAAQNAIREAKQAEKALRKEANRLKREEKKAKKAARGAAVSEEIVEC